jgi:hypothetical protein
MFTGQLWGPNLPLDRADGMAAMGRCTPPRAHAEVNIGGLGRRLAKTNTVVLADAGTGTSDSAKNRSERLLGRNSKSLPAHPNAWFLPHGQFVPESFVIGPPCFVQSALNKRPTPLLKRARVWGLVGSG